MRFCAEYQLQPLPLSENTLVRLASYLARTGILYSSIRIYISGLRFLQLQNGFPDPSLSSFAQLECVLRGIRKSTANQPRYQRLPITPAILQHLFNTWSQPPVTYDAVMLWAACCLGFFGFLRSGEFTCPSATTYKSFMLSTRDIGVDSHTNPTFITVNLRRSKTDIFSRGVTIYLGRTKAIICPVAAMLAYLSIRPPTQGPLFIYADGTSLSRQRLVVALREALEPYGTNTRLYNGHSFRIGAATTAAACGFEDSLIQVLGRWKSSAFLSYIRTPIQTLVGTSSRMLANGV